MSKINLPVKVNTPLAGKTAAEEAEDAVALHADEEMRHTVMGFILAGMSPEKMCLLVTDPITGKRMTPGRFRAVFAEEIAAGPDGALALTRSSLYRTSLMTGTTASVAAARALLPAYDPDKFSSKTRVEVTGKDGGAIEHEVKSAMEAVKTALNTLHTVKQGRAKEAVVK